MRSYGLSLIILGFFALILFWVEYFNNITYILSLGKMSLYILLFIGMLVTLAGGLLIGVGITVVIHPEFYDKLKALIKE